MINYEGPSIFSTEKEVFLLTNRVGSNTNVGNNVLGRLNQERFRSKKNDKINLNPSAAEHEYLQLEHPGQPGHLSRHNDYNCT